MASVSVQIDLTHLVDPLSYAWPTSLGPPPEVGSIVRVPLNTRTERGWVLGPGREGSEEIRLKSVKSVIGAGPTPDVVAFAEAASRAYLCSPAHFLILASPHAATKLAATPSDDPSTGVPGTPAFVPILTGLNEQHSLIWAPPDGTSDDRSATIAREAVAGGRSAIIVLPNLSRVRALRRRLVALRVRVLQFPEEWREVRSAVDPVVVVGPRSAVAAPVPQLGVVVVVDPEERSMRESSNPYYETFELARLRAESSGAHSVLISMAPRLEMLHGVHGLLPPAAKMKEAWARLSVTDSSTLTSPLERVGELFDRSRRIWERAYLATQSEGTSALRLLVIFNRKGFVNRLRCAQCKAEPVCQGCGSHLSGRPGRTGVALSRWSEVMRQRNAVASFACSNCARETPAVCRLCRSVAFVQRAKGTSKVASEIESILQVPVLDLTAGEGAGQDRGPEPVAVGTEAALSRGLRAATVLFLDFDQILNDTSMDVEINAFRLLALASSVTSPMGGVVEIQSSSTSSPVIEAAVNGSPTLLYRGERESRQRLGLPPYRSIALVKGGRTSEFLALVAKPDDLSIDPLDDGSLMVVGEGFNSTRTWLRAYRDDLVRLGLRVEQSPRSIP